MEKKYVDVEKVNSIPTIKQQMRNINNNIEVIENSVKTVEDDINDIEEEVEQLAANTVIFKAESGVIQKVQGTLPAYADIFKTRFVYYDGTNIVPLSISYTGSIIASGMFIPYANVDPKLLYFTCGYNESSIIGTEVTIKDF